MQKLTEIGFKAKLNTKKNLFLVLEQQGCQHCKEYQTILPAAEKTNPDYEFCSLEINDLKKSDFAQTYLASMPSVGFPSTVIFIDGEFKQFQRGKINADQIQQFIQTGKITPFKPVEDEILRGLNAEKFYIESDLLKAQRRYATLQNKLQLTQEEAEEGGQMMNIIEQCNVDKFNVNNKISDRIKELQKSDVPDA